MKIKKIFLLSWILLVSLSMAACSSINRNSNEKELTLDIIKQAYTDNGYSVTDEKPMFQMIKASNGIIFYATDGTPVKIYEYKSVKEIENFKKEIPLLENFKQNGRFLLEASDSDIIEIFESIGKNTTPKSSKKDEKYSSNCKETDFIKTESSEIKIKSLDVNKEAKEEKETGTTSFVSENGVFIIINFEVKNLKTQTDYIFGDNEKKLVLEYNGKYKYTPAVNLGEDSLITNQIDPLVKKKGYVLFDVPEEVGENVSKCKLFITLDNKKYSYSLSKLEALESVE